MPELCKMEIVELKDQRSLLVGALATDRSEPIIGENIDLQNLETLLVSKLEFSLPIDHEKKGEGQRSKAFPFS